MNDIRGYSCELCGIKCNSSDQLRAHQSGKSHIRKCEVALSASKANKFDCYQPWQVSPRSDSSVRACPKCSEEFSAVEMFAHDCNGTSVNDFSSASALSARDFFSNPKVSLSEKSEFFCPICHVSLHSKSNFLVHVQGKRHLDKQKHSSSRLEIEEPNASKMKLLSCSLEGLFRLEADDDPYKEASFTKPSVNSLSRDLNAVIVDNGYSCDACKLCLNSEAQLRDHFNGRKHRILVARCNTKLNLFDPHIFSTNPPSNVYPALLNPNLCTVCEVPVALTEMEHHRKGRTHIFKSAMAGCAKVCKDCLTEDRCVQRGFSSRLPFILRSISFPEALHNCLTKLAELSKDTIVQMACSDSGLISRMALAIALGALHENRANIDQAPCHCFAMWICPIKSVIQRRMEEVRRLTEHLPEDRPRLVNILKDSFSLDDQTCEITQHEIVFSTSGGLLNLLQSYSNLQKAMCAILLTDAEGCVVSDPTDGLLSYFFASVGENSSNRPRIFIITTKEMPDWQFLKSFSTLQLRIPNGEPII